MRGHDHRNTQLGQALADGKEAILFPDKVNIRYLYPVLAEEECLSCHTRSSLGSVHGVIDIVQPIGNLKVPLAYVINALVQYTLIATGLVFVALHFTLRYLVGRPILDLANVMRETAGQSDLNHRAGGVILIAELRLLSEYFDRLMSALQSRENALRESETRFRMTFELAGSGIAHVDLDGYFLRVNRSLCSMLGYSDKELVKLTVKELSHPEDRDVTDAGRVGVRGGGSNSAQFQKRYLHKSGATVWVDLTVALAQDDQGKPLYEIAVFDDITERKLAEQALRDSSEELRLFADNVPAMTISFDNNLRCLFVNKRYADFFGYGTADILGKHLREIVGEAAYSEIEGHFVQVLQGHPVTYQRTRTLSDGEVHYLEVKVLPRIADQGKVLGCFAVTTDITEHKLAEERIQRVAQHDNLTGLANRLLFNDRLNQAINLAKRNSRQVALLYLDLDKFKPVNDTMGHSAGDELLKGVAERLQRQVRESDTVARIGGDEFTVILPDIARREEAETVANKIVAALGTPFQLGSSKQSLEIGTSIGIALYPADAQDVDALIKAADAAMYCSKQAGKGLHDSSIVGDKIVGA